MKKATIKRHFGRFISVFICCGLVYIGTYIFLLCIPTDIFLLVQGYKLENADWYYQNTDESVYILEIDEQANVEFLKFTKVSRFLPCNVIKLSDSFSCDLNSFSIEKCAGWEDAEINELTDHQRVSISEKFYGIKDGQMGDFKITLEISTGSHNNEDVAFCRNIIIGEKEYTIMIAVLEA